MKVDFEGIQTTLAKKDGVNSGNITIKSWFFSYAGGNNETFHPNVSNILPIQTVVIAKLYTFHLNVRKLQKPLTPTTFILFVTLIAWKFTFTFLWEWTVLTIIVNTEYEIILIVSI